MTYKKIRHVIDVRVEKGGAIEKECCALVVGISGKGLPNVAKELDKAVDGALSRIVGGEDVGSDPGKGHLMFSKHLPIKPERIILIGVGKGGGKNKALENLRQGYAAAAAMCENRGLKHIVGLLPPNISADTVQAMVEAFVIGAYRWDTYKRRKRKGAESFTVLVSNAKDKRTAEKAAHAGRVVSESTCMVRDLANCPSNDLRPKDLAKLAEALGKEYGFKVNILGKKEIEKAEMHGLLAVSRGSAEEPRFIELEWNGTRSKKTRPIVFVGKAITFDTGGISIKPVANMDQMKYDMAGGATVLGTITAAARSKLPLRIIGLIPSSENMPDGKAYKPGDVIEYKNGRTVEIISTDAEGRLILADGLLRAGELDPTYVIDTATLTGGVKVALAKIAAGILGNDDRLVNGLIKAGGETHERLWRLPLWPEYNDLIKGDTADIKNSGGREGSTCTAAALLNNFVSYPWAHVDIAGMGWSPSGKGYLQKGATGFGVRLFMQWLRSQKTR